MQDLHVTYAVAGTLAVAVALVSSKMRQVPVSGPLLALATGVLVGPQVLGWIAISDSLRDPLLLETSRILLAASVMAAALRFPARDLRPLVRTVVLMLLLVLPLMAAISGAAALLLGLPLALAALVGACLAPTDPVLAASVVSGSPAQRDLPARVRQLITEESGSNDGLALPLVVLALAAVLPERTFGDAVLSLLWSVLAGALIGLAAGALTGRVLRRNAEHEDVEPGPELVLTLLLAVAVLGLARLANTDGILAVFVAGLAYNYYAGEDARSPAEGVDEAINRFAVLPFFVLVGLVLPWDVWISFGPVALAFVAAVLLLRRPLVVLALSPLIGLRVRDAAFVGWFGPVGVSAVFYLAHSLDHGVTDERFFAAGILAVCASVVAFGISSSPGRKLYARTRPDDGG
jgi:NhaP-type Na+/H+ or K+/H+ antiporter